MADKAKSAKAKRTTLGVREKLILRSIAVGETKTKREIDDISAAISQREIPKGRYGSYDNYWWEYDNAVIIKRLIAKGFLERVYRGTYTRIK